MSYQKINWMHIMFIGPLLVLIGHQGKKTQQIFYGSLMTLTALLFFIVRTPDFKLNYRNTINWVHWIVWPAVFIWISWKQSEIPDYGFQIIKYLGISVILIHMYLLYQHNWGIVLNKKQN